VCSNAILGGNFVFLFRRVILTSVGRGTVTHLSHFHVSCSFISLSLFSSFDLENLLSSNKLSSNVDDVQVYIVDLEKGYFRELPNFPSIMPSARFDQLRRSLTAIASGPGTCTSSEACHSLVIFQETTERITTTTTTTTTKQE
jgi:hypothetical protein